METAIISVEGMMCEHCVKAVTKAVGALPGIGGVAVDLAAGTVTVSYNAGAVALREIQAAIEEQGYDVAY
ncbi:MAG: copper ion binding protein [Oscillospiraceae bacterium]|nr:copper ion binding protein [Oscillospiraceae bacterium]